MAFDAADLGAFKGIDTSLADTKAPSDSGTFELTPLGIDVSALSTDANASQSSIEESPVADLRPSPPFKADLEGVLDLTGLPIEFDQTEPDMETGEAEEAACADVPIPEATTFAEPDAWMEPTAAFNARCARSDHGQASPALVALERFLRRVEARKIETLVHSVAS
jgi:hypothetical protein